MRGNQPFFSATVLRYLCRKVSACDFDWFALQKIARHRKFNAMICTRVLHQLLDVSASRFPDNVAVEEAGRGTIGYGELARLSDRVRDHLLQLRVEPGDRVGICMRKSADAVASIFGIMKAGAAYIPADPTAPASRNAFIFHNCAVKILIVEARLAEALRLEFSQVSFAPEMIVLEGTGAGVPLTKALDRLDAVRPAPSVPSVVPNPSQLAYILYTSGSTGRPKGVMLSHGNAASFIDWCSDVLQPNEHDRFSSHAPFHFDLSILDIYVSLKHGATLVLVEEQRGKEPARLAPWIAEKKITVWYSAPSILSLLAQFGKLDQHNYSSLRLVLFAGEVRAIHDHLARKGLSDQIPETIEVLVAASTLFQSVWPN